MNDRTIGRAGFLGLLGVGAVGLFFARDATGFLGRTVPKSVSSLVPTGGWRIYTVGASMPDPDPATFRLTVGGLVERPASFSLQELKAMPRADQVSDFHCVTGWSVSGVRWGGIRITDLLERVGADKSAHGLRFVSAEVPYEDSLTVEQALLPDVMLAYAMDGGPDLEAARCAGPPRDAPDVRVQERQVGAAHRGAGCPGGGILGAARLRRGRMAREVEWLLGLTPSSGPGSRGSRARSACSTGCTPRHFWPCSRPG